jgi:hypothetical protein
MTAATQCRTTGAGAWSADARSPRAALAQQRPVVSLHSEVAKMPVKTPRHVPIPLALLALLVAACGGSDSGTDVPPPTPTIGVSAAPATLTLTQGQNGTATVTITRGGNFAGAVNLAATGAPTGVTATLNPTARP